MKMWKVAFKIGFITLGFCAFYGAILWTLEQMYERMMNTLVGGGIHYTNILSPESTVIPILIVVLSGMLVGIGTGISCD